MAYQENSSVASINQLLSQLKNFLISVGWVVNQETNTGLTPSLSIKKGTSYITLSYALIGSVGWLTLKTEASYLTVPSSEVYCNDLQGAYATVWFFADPLKNYCHVVTTKEDGTYNHFSFGQVDNIGFSTPQVTYATGSRFDFTTVPSILARGYGYVAHCSNSSLNIPDDVLSESFSPNGRLSITTVETTFDTDRLGPGGFPYTSFGETFAILDYVVDLVNVGVTGGMHLHTIPHIAVVNTFMHNIGVAPDVRLCSIADIQEGEEINNSGTIWKIFPARKRGVSSSLIPGAEMHSCNLGLAYKKT
jgi:hypothetical protein